jgi:hypothetical protein
LLIRVREVSFEKKNFTEINKTQRKKKVSFRVRRPGFNKQEKKRRPGFKPDS